jgi:non-ribosomal peptide synthetase component F
MILQVQREYWRQTLSDVSALDFMPDHPGTDRFVAGRHPFALDPEVTAQLQHLVERRGANLSVALLGAFTVLLHRYTGQRDLCVGAGAMPLRTHVEPDDTFSALLTQVKASWLEAQQHQDVPVEAAPFGLTAMSIDYNAALYEPETIQRMAEHFVALCRAVAAKPAAKIRTLNFLSDAEKQRVIVDFNDTYADSPNNRCVHHLLGDQIALHPESTALALHLQSIGVTPDSLVAICVERSVDPVTAILGTLQAGGAYLLLDPADADDQLAYVLQDSAAPVVLTQEKLRYRLAPLVASNAKLVPLDQRVPATHGTLREDVKPSHACCVSYAAGDAGKPKGVVVEHKAMVNRVSWLQRRYALDVMSALTAVTLPSLYRPADNAIEVADDRPADNSRIYILDPHGHPQPIGVAGEICVAGESLAREFLHRPKQTQESFVANPFVPGTRMLRTGDRGRWRNDGTLQYLGGKQ